MGDGSFIPGISDKYNSNEAIDKVMRAKRVKLKSLEKDKEDLIKIGKAWNEIKKKLVSLSSKAKDLYSFKAPFEEKISKSSDENSFNASVTRTAEIGEYSFEVLQKSTAHRIASDSLPKNYKIPAGRYKIFVGKNEVNIPYDGGAVDNFLDKIKLYGKDNLKATITWNTKDSQILILEAGKTGKDNVITFGDEKTKSVFKKMGFFENTISYDKKIQLTQNNVKDLSNVRTSINFLQNNSLLLKPNTIYRINLPESIPYRENLKFQIDMKIDKIDTQKLQNREPTGPNFTREGNLTIFDENVKGESSIINIPKFVKNNEKPKIVNDDHYIEIVTNKRTIKIDELDVSQNKKTLEFNIPDIIRQDESIEALVLKNNNTLKKLETGNLRFFDETSLAGVKYRHLLSEPKDSIIKLDGIKVKRDSNTLDDVIKGVTLYIFNKTNGEGTLQIDRDYDKIVSAITDFFKDYNDLIKFINKETTVKSDGKGEFAGDYMLSSMVNKLRNIMMNPHKTAYGEEMALLSQIGISTNSSTEFSLDRAKMDGTLEVDENVFLQKLEKNTIGIKQLFGYDQDSDYIIDTGVAFDISQLLKGYTEKGTGIFDARNHTYREEIKQKEKDIVSYKEKMTKEEQKLREQFYKMEKSANELEENTKKFDNFNKQN